MAFAPRLPIALTHAGQDISAELIYTGSRWWSEMNFFPGRSPLYLLSIGALDKIFQGIGVPYFYYKNILSILRVFVTLCLLFELFRKYLSFQESLFGVLLVNFYPHELVMGAATTDVNFLVLFSVATIYALMREKPYWALFFSVCAALSRIQGAVLAAPMMLLVLRRDLASKDRKRLLRDLLLCFVLGLPILRTAWGQSVLYHIG